MQAVYWERQSSAQPRPGGCAGAGLSQPWSQQVTQRTAVAEFLHPQNTATIPGPPIRCRVLISVQGGRVPERIRF